MLRANRPGPRAARIRGALERTLAILAAGSLTGKPATSKLTPEQNRALADRLTLRLAEVSKGIRS